MYENYVFKTAILNAKEHLKDESPRQIQPGDIPSIIVNLDYLRQQGILSEEEFQLKKAELLSRL